MARPVTVWTAKTNPATVWTAKTTYSAMWSYAIKLRQYYIQEMLFMPIQGYTAAYGVPIQSMKDNRTAWTDPFA